MSRTLAERQKRDSLAISIFVTPATDVLVAASAVRCVSRRHAGDQHRVPLFHCTRALLGIRAEGLRLGHTLSIVLKVTFGLDDNGMVPAVLEARSRSSQ